LSGLRPLPRGRCLSGEERERGDSTDCCHKEASRGPNLAATIEPLPRSQTVILDKIMHPPFHLCPSVVLYTSFSSSAFIGVHRRFHVLYALTVRGQAPTLAATRNTRVLTLLRTPTQPPPAICKSGPGGSVGEGKTGPPGGPSARGVKLGS
jgi:hypothetical protein